MPFYFTPISGTCVCLCAFVLSSSAKFLTAVQFNSEKFKSHWINMRSYFQSITSKYDYEHLIPSVENKSPNLLTIPYGNTSERH